ncbi:MAG TPA: ATP-binding protein [Candidatus Saccharimonadales bacterium]|nr:ATP-binding protein [Candidatus Saccharimonadales bacterium]
MQEEKDYLVIDGRYVRTILISAFPAQANHGWMDSLINFHHDADIAFHIERVPTDIALSKITRKITEMQSAVNAKITTNSPVPPHLAEPLASATKLQTGLSRGEQQLFQVSIYVTINTEKLEELQNVTKMLISVLAARLFFMEIATFQQVEGLQTILPRAENILAQKRNLDSSTAALAFPFVSSQLVQENGILYGVDDKTKSLVMVNRFGLHNANSIMFGETGGGKSFTSKVDILRNLARGTQVIVIDPEREYEKLAKSVGGTYINLSPTSKNHINPFDMAATAHTKDQLAEHAQDLTEIIARMVANPDKRDNTPALTMEERAVVDEVILKIYKDAEGDKPPTLQKFYDVAHNKGLISLCKRLEKYLTGTLDGLFNKQTNIKLDNRLVIFDIKDLKESVRQPMMMVISTFVQNRVKADPKKRMLVIDEAWLLLQDEESARFVAEMVRRARKNYLAVSIISQQASDFLENKYGRTIASQSALRILLKLDTTACEDVAEVFKLSDHEKRYLLECKRGDALIIADQNHAAVHITASDKEYSLITTDPAEVYDT